MAARDAYVGVGVLRVISVINLPKMDTFGSCDPQVIVRTGLSERRTRVVKNKRSACFNEGFVFLLRQSETAARAVLDVVDIDVGTRDEYIGSVDVPLAVPFADTPYPLQWRAAAARGASKPPAATLGTVVVAVEYYDVNAASLLVARDLFAVFDADKSGHLDPTEAAAAFCALGADPAAAERALTAAGASSFTPDSFVAALRAAGVAMAPAAAAIPGSVFAQAALLCGAPEAVEAATGGDATARVLVTAAGVMSRGLGAVMADDALAARRIATRHSAAVQVRERHTGLVLDEVIPTYVQLALDMLYGKDVVVAAGVAWALNKMTRRAAAKMDSPDSKADIPDFVARYGINPAECELPLALYPTMNAFFYRKLAAGARPTAAPGDAAVAVCPADARTLAFESVEAATQLWIKGKGFTLGRLLDDDALGAEFTGGVVVVSRLAPQDYHRFHSPVTGRLVGTRAIAGDYYTVNPRAVRGPIAVFSQNTRVICRLDTPAFGRVVFVAIGATMVGSVNITAAVGAPVEKGGELGYFAFGGSTVVTLFAPRAAVVEADIAANSRVPVETLCRVGSALATAPGHGSAEYPAPAPTAAGGPAAASPTYSGAYS